MDVKISLPFNAPELQEQALAYRDVTEFCLSQSNCKAIVTWGFTDKYSWVPGFFNGFGDALIFDANYQPKPAYSAIQSVLEANLQGPPIPTGLAAIPGNTQVQLSWNASSGATSYNVKRSTTAGGPYTTIASLPGTSFTNTSLTNGTAYFYVVSAVNANGESANSSQVSAIPIAANFTLSANPTSFTINRGANGTSTITVTRTGGFSASVAFSASGLPAGVTASFSPTSTTGTSCTLTFSASTTATLGPATVTVTGTGGGLTRTTTINLTVNAPPTPDFSLSPSPPGLAINRGASATSTITVTRSGGFSASLTFSASGLPAGVTASFTPPSTTGTSSTLLLSASSTATLGAASATVTASGGGLSRSTSVTLTVNDPGGGTGGVTLTPVINASGPWFNEEALRLSNTAPLTALSLTIVIQRTTGISFSGQYNTVGGQILQSNSSTATTITYQFSLAPGQMFGTGMNRLFAAQMGGTGTVHPMSGDTYTVTYTTGGVTFTQTGHF